MKVRYLKSDELRHHGVEGQKWGVKNGPPYPLDSSVSTGRQLKKAQKNFIKGYEKAGHGTLNVTRQNQARREYIKNNVKQENLNALKQKSANINKIMGKMIDKETVKKYWNESGNKANKKIKKQDYNVEKEYYLDVSELATNSFMDKIEDHFSNHKNKKELDLAINEYINTRNKLVEDLIGEYKDKPYQGMPSEYYVNSINESINRISDTPISTINLGKYSGGIKDLIIYDNIIRKYL